MVELTDYKNFDVFENTFEFFYENYSKADSDDVVSLIWGDIRSSLGYPLTAVVKVLDGDLESREAVFSIYSFMWEAAYNALLKDMPEGVDLFSSSPVTVTRTR